MNWLNLYYVLIILLNIVFKKLGRLNDKEPLSNLF